MSCPRCKTQLKVERNIRTLYLQITCDKCDFQRYIAMETFVGMNEKQIVKLIEEDYCKVLDEKRRRVMAELERRMKP